MYTWTIFLSVCPTLHSYTTARSWMYWGMVGGAPRVVYYWTDLQSMPGFYCYDNITYSYVQYNYRLTSELVLALTLFSQPPVKFTKT